MPESDLCAVRLYAIPRATYDVDFAISVAPESLNQFYTAARAEGFEVPEYQETGWLDRVGLMHLVKLQSRFASHPIDIDLFLAESPFLQSVLNRRHKESAEGFTAWYPVLRTSSS